MKKWFIFAVIAAVFMVTFPACGGDEDSAPAASEVKATLYQSYFSIPLVNSDGTAVNLSNGTTAINASTHKVILLEWTADPVYDYYFVWQKKNDLTKQIGGTNISLGQNIYKYDVPKNDAGVPQKIVRSINDDKSHWSVLIVADSGADAGVAPSLPIDSGNPHGILGYPDFYLALLQLEGITGAVTTEVAEGRFGVAAAIPGGFPLENVKTVWDVEAENDPTVVDPNPAVPVKDFGFFRFTIPVRTVT
jgi:hypothetical protein